MPRAGTKKQPAIRPVAFYGTFAEAGYSPVQLEMLRGVPFVPVRCATHHFTGPFDCTCPLNPQYTAWYSTADEIGLGGSRGSAKTHLSIGWIAFKGNIHKWEAIKKAGEKIEGADVMYINQPHFRGLAMREQANDMIDLIDRCEKMWAPTGATIVRGNPAYAEWPTGAKIIFGHFGDQGYKKYIGQEYQRIFIDQAEKLESKEIYDRIVGSCRSRWPELIPQVILTFNPGGGTELGGAPGQAWLMEHFHIEDFERGELKGRKLVYGTLLQSKSGKTKTFIQSTYKDNPYFYHDYEHDKEGKLVRYQEGQGKYVKWLDSISSDSLRSAWRDCQWHAMTGQFFSSFRPNGPLRGEPDNARHVYDPSEVRLEPWFHAWASMDWGYIHPTVYLLHRKAPWGQIYTTDEIALNRVEPTELGVLLGHELRKVLDGLENKHIALFLSPDAWAKRESEDTVASQLTAGLNIVLGAGSAFLAELTEAERLMSPNDALESMKRRRRAQAETHVTILRASTDRVAGWMHMQTLLRWRPLKNVQKPDKEFADKLYREQGIVAYQNYMNLPEFKEAAEILPKWQISNQCRYLIRGLKEAIFAPGTNDCAKHDATDTAPGDDACFVAGTLVETAYGPKPIETIAVGDMVWTRKGLRRVQRTYNNGLKPTIKVTCDDGTELIGTDNHPVWTNGNWRPLHVIRPGDILETWQSSKKRVLTESFTSFIPEKSTSLRCEERANHFIAPYIDSTRETSRAVLKSITRTGTLGITISAILNLLNAGSIVRCTARKNIKSTPVNSKRDLPLGNVLLRGVNTIAGSVRKYGLLARCALKRHAKNAVSILFPAISTERDGALVLALSGIDAGINWTLPTRYAQYAPTHLARRTTPKLARSRVVGSSRHSHECVYNLGVEEENEYFANGILVHNCDAARYGLLSEERQGQSFAPLEVRIQNRIAEVTAQYPGLSDHSRIEIARKAREHELHHPKSETLRYSGHNRLAVRRALHSHQFSERTLA